MNRDKDDHERRLIERLTNALAKASLRYPKGSAFRGERLDAATVVADGRAWLAAADAPEAQAPPEQPVGERGRGDE